jgi:hypothetical protein
MRLTRRSSGRTPAGLDCAFANQPARRCAPLTWYVGLRSKAMPNGKYEPQCGNCTSRKKADSRPGFCSKHEFVMPWFDDYVVCCDWQSIWNKASNNPFGGTLESGVLYRWDEYFRYRPEPIGRFEEIKDFLLDRHWSLFDNPNHGWSVQLAPWDHELFPAPGEALNISLDKTQVPFTVRDAPITTTYTRRLPSGELDMEDRTETKRILLPSQGHEKALLEWIERHYDVSRAREKKAKSLLDPTNLYKDKVLRLMIRIVGTPDNGRYEFLPSPIGAL